MNRSVIFFTIFAIIIGGVFSVKAQNSESPVEIVSAYYEAINGKNFERAYAFWRTPNDTMENFVKSYNETEKVRLIIEPPAAVEGAAGSLYAQVPSVLISTMKNGKTQKFSGCHILQKSNLRPPEIQKIDTWHIFRANLKPAAANAEIPQLLDEACAETANLPDEQKSSRVLGVITLGEEGTNESISIPATVEANKDFEIIVTTSGDGCVSAADTGVILGEMSADVFVYDFTTANRPGIACTMIFKTLPHKATLRFTKTGEATIRIWGRKQGGDSPFGEPIILIRRITVK